MKDLVSLFLLFTLSTFVNAQVPEENAKQSYKVSANLNFTKDDFFILPIGSAELDRFHLETRYNYEDINTVSIWSGYRFSGGEILEYSICPMAGIVAGNTDGYAPGIELKINWSGFELYSESEYLINSEGKEENYFYNWVDFIYSPKDFFWLGISGQRLKTYHSGLELQKGLILGFGRERFNIVSYFYNPFHNDFFYIMSLNARM